MTATRRAWVALLGLVVGLAFAPGLASAQEWPMRRADQANTGRATAGSAMAAPSPKFELSLGGRVQLDPRFGEKNLVLDVDNDGEDELVYIVGGRLVARKADNTLVWDTTPRRLLNIVGASDLNGDGRVEIVARRFELGGLIVVDGLTGTIVHERVGQARIFGAQIATVPTTGGDRNIIAVSGQDAEQVGFVRVLDFTDATLDATTGRFVPSSVVSAYYRDHRQFNAIAGSTVPNIAFPLYALVANFDGDAGGSMEMVVDRITEIYLYTFGWNGTALTVDFQIADVVPNAYPTGIAVRDFYVEDIDNNGDLEIFWAGGGPFKHRADRVDLANSGGTWTISRVWTYDFSGDLFNTGREVLTSVDSLVDIDGDGDVELVVAGFNHTNDGLWHTQIIDTGSVATAVVEQELLDKAFLGIANCDADATPELIVASGADANVLSGLSTIEVYDVTDGARTLKTSFPNAGGSWFAANGAALTPSSLGNYSAMDLNGDGIDELFVQVDTTGDGQPDEIRAVDCTGANVASFTGNGGALAPADGFGGGTVLLDLLAGQIAIVDASLTTLSSVTSGGLEVDRARTVVDDLSLGDSVQANLIVQAGTREVRVYNFNNFPTSAPQLRWSYQASGLVYPIVADVMGDADKEVIIFDDLGAGKVLRVFDDQGVQQASIAVAAAVSGNGWVKPAATGNGKVDLVGWYQDTTRTTNQNVVFAWDPENPATFVWTNDGSTIGTAGQFAHAPTTREFAVANLDGDADDDVVYHRREDTGVAGSVLRIHEIDGTTGATLAAPLGDLRIESGTDTSSDIQLFDIDDDGTLEIVMAGYVNRYEVVDVTGNLEYQRTFDGFIASQNLTAGIAVPAGGGVARVGVPSRYGHLRIFSGAASIPTFGTCSQATDCPAGQGCNTELGACVNRCGSSQACPTGQVCNQATGLLTVEGGGANVFVCVEPTDTDFVYSDGARFASAASLPLAPGAIGHVISGDVDGNDGGLEEFVFGSTDGYLYVVNSDDATIEWAYNADGSIFDAIMADVNADGASELVFVTSQGILNILGTEGIPAPGEVRDVQVSGGVVIQPLVDIDEAESVGQLGCAWEGVTGAQVYHVTLRTDAGTIVGQVDVNSTGAVTESVVVTASSFSLNRTYFCQVQAEDAAGLTSSVVTSDGVTIVDDSVPQTITLTATPECFNPIVTSTTIDYEVRDLTALSAWSLEITDAGGTVVAQDGAPSINQPSVSGSFVWDGRDSGNTALPDGDYTVTLSGTDFSGQSGGSSITVCIDTVAPDAPVIVAPTEGQRIGDTEPNFAGTASNADEGTVSVFLAADDSVLCTADVDAAGDWQCTSTVTLTDGVHVVYAVATDPSANASAASTDRTFEIDTTLPTAPIILSPTDGAVLPGGLVTVDGTTEPDTTVEVYLRDTTGDTLGCTAAAVADTFACDLGPLTDGSYTIFAVATDSLAQVSAESATVSFIVDEDGDTDNDGIPDYWEQRYGLDPNDPSDALGDLDSDTLTNLAEFDAGSNPTDRDSDEDGLCDNDEIDWDVDTDGDLAINAMDADSDNDGILDAVELGRSSACSDQTDLLVGLFVADADPSSVTSMVDADSDGDGIRDGAEDPDHNGRVDADETDPEDDTTDPSAAILVDSDGDGLTDAEETLLRSSPDDGDSDDDGVLDGAEPNFSADGDGDGLANVVDPDSDNDGLADGTEAGVTTAPNATDVARGRFIVDGDPASRTSVVLADTDGDGIRDGAEDSNYNGVAEAGELDPTDAFSDPASATLIDTDGDGLTDNEETFLASLVNDNLDHVNDGDVDDDGVLDGDEPNWWDDNDADGTINVVDPDSDNDCLPDGTEAGVVVPGPDTDVAAGNFTPDEDPDSTTLMLVADTDLDQFTEDLEDLNCDGAIDEGETDPNDPADFPMIECTTDEDCDGDFICQDDICVPPDVTEPDVVEQPDTAPDVMEPGDDTSPDVMEMEADELAPMAEVKGGGCSCRVTADTRESRDLPVAPFALGVLGLLGAVVLRRRRR